MATPPDRDAAVEACRKAVEFAPKEAKPRYQLGNALRKVGKNTEAIASYREAIALDPGYAAAYGNMGLAFFESGEIDEAVGCYRRAAELDPSSATAHFNYAKCLRVALRLDEALAHFERALALAPANAAYHWNYALVLLMAGRYEEGWREYEWRWEGCTELKGGKPRFRKPEWNGEDIAGKTILLYREQGLGDVIQFARYAPLLAARGAKVILACQRSQVRLFAGMDGISQAVGWRQRLPRFDTYCTLLKLPLLLGTTLATVPARVPYVHADPALVAAWRQRMGSAPGLKVGLIWGGTAKSRSDEKRSVALADLGPLAQVPGVQFYSLQMGEHAAQAKSPPPGMKLIDWTDDIHDFADTAALMANLDLVISVDTAGVHLAGALGKPVWLLNRHESEWRWMLGREDSPWYPTLRIFRQPQRGDWKPVVGKVAAELAGLARKSGARPAEPQPTAADAHEIEACRKAVELAPSEAKPRFELGNVLRKLGRNAEAVASYREAIALDPGFLSAYNNMGLAFYGSGEIDEAVRCYRRAIELNPRYPHAYNNLGTALMARNELEEAAASCRKAVELEPSSVSAHFNYANCLRATLRLDEALSHYERALALAPANAAYHWNYAVALLMAGRYEEGWREYEWRWEGCPDFKGGKPRFKQPEWNGEDIAGKTILLYREQGLGDVIQFARYAALVAARRAKVVLACQPEQVRLFAGMEGVSQVVSYRGPLPPFDVYVPLLKLPLLFGTTLATVPARVPYVHADPALVAAWRQRMGPAPGLKVGLIWGGRLGQEWRRKRSFELSDLAPLARTKGVQFYSLQKGEHAVQAKSPPPGMKLIDWTDDIHDFADTAALMANLDLVISVDTAGAHLAGALGKPVWLMLRHESDWRYLLERKDSPWYPTMRIFRQPGLGDWEIVVEKVAAELAVLAGGSGARERDEEIEACRKAVELAPKEAKPRYFLANLLRLRGDIDAAIASYREAIALDPGHVSAHNNLAVALKDAGRLDEAIPSLRRAIELNPRYAPAYNNLGSALLECDEPEEAMANCGKACQLDPASPSTLFNYANCCRANLRLDEALPLYERAIALEPANAVCHWNYSIALLLTGRYEKGWREYEWRWEGSPDTKGARPAFKQPEWNGEDIAGKTILLYREQGYGDVIQFARYAALVAARGAKVILACQPEQVRLFAGMEGVSQVVSYRGPLPPFDVHVPLLKLPLLFGTTLATVPARVPYVHADPALVAAWRQRMGPAPGLKVGLVWGGKPGQRWRRKRSFELGALAPLARVKGVQFYSLQKGEHAVQAKSPPSGMKLIDWTDDIHDFADTAALMANLDLVISVDTAGAHLAGALGKPVWLLNRYESEWRWMLGREDSPWYPTLRIFRQPGLGDWKTVVEKVAAELAGLAGGSAGQADSHRLLGNQLAEAGNTDAAVVSYRRAIALEPGSARAHHELGAVLAKANRYLEALVYYRRAVELEPAHPGALRDLAAACLALGETEDAIANYRRAVEIEPASDSTHYALGNACRRALRIDDAIASFGRAIELAPAPARYRANRAMAMLLKGDYAQGWKEYEWRWQGAVESKGKPAFEGPEWNGGDLRGKTILLYSEQGLGDQIQFIRYAPLVAARGARVVVRCHSSVARLLRGAPAVDQAVPTDAPLPPFDTHRALLSLPLSFGTTLETIPARVPYLTADKDLAAAWRARMGSPTALKVGLAWGGNEQNRGDAVRSIPLASFAPLARAGPVLFYSLQKGSYAAQAKSPPTGMKLVDWTDELRDFADTAALVANLDLVISADTAVAHLAGAMGKPVWLLNRYESEWRWLLGREDSPWYPTMRIFRQPRLGDWKPLLNDVADALAALAGKSLETAPPSSGSGLPGVAAADLPSTEKRLREVIAKSPTALRHADLAEVLKAQGRRKDAIAAYRKAVRIAPKDSRFRMSLGNLFSEEERYGRAVIHFREAAALTPDLAAAHQNLASALRKIGRHAQSIPILRRALELKPDDPELITALGSSFLELKDFSGAVQQLDKAVAANPASHDARFGLGNAWLGLLDVERAIENYERAIALSPETPNFHWNYAIALLLKGDYARGWKEYEWRWDGASQSKGKPHWQGPEWNGEDIRGKTILLYSEQGIGDELQFIRYAPLVAARGAKVVARCHTPLAQLFRGMPGISHAVSAKMPVPPYDTHRALLSLPLLFGTTLETIPARVPYLAAEQGLVAAWRARMGASPALKVGLIWGGRANSEWYRTRSCELADLAPLAQIRGVELYSLQKGEQAAQARFPPPGMKLIDWTDDLHDFADTAALMANLDLMISVDTAGAHLAGALGRPVWLMLRHESDWRYFLEREDSPWYPTMRIFRQPRHGDWKSVADKITAALAELAANSGKPAAPRKTSNKPSIESLRRAVELEPDDPKALLALASAYVDVKEFRSAVPPLEKAVAINPASHIAQFNLANAWLGLLDVDRALPIFERAIALAPKNPQFHWNYAIALLLKGDYARGWKEYESRWSGATKLKEKPKLPGPEWKGENIKGKTIVLYCEQGAGDAIHFIRYAPMVAARGAQVVVRCHESLGRLFRSVPGIEVVTGKTPQVSRFHTHRALLSLPLVFGTTLKTIPARVPYLAADKDLAAAWRARMGTSSGLKVGLVWGGRVDEEWQRTRSMDLSDLAPLAQVKDVQFYSLQKGEHAAQTKSPLPGMSLVDWTGEIDDFADTAALIANLDLVISVDTAGAHLAGALGKPVWLMLRYESDWRYLLERSDSPWYPTMRIFRQPRMGDWASVAGEVAKALAALSGKAPMNTDLPRVEKLLSEAIKKAPTATRHADLAEVLKAQGKNEDAIAAYRNAVKLDSGDSRLHMSLANLLVEAGDVAEAISHYHKVIELRPTLGSAHNNLASALATLGRSREALESSERATSLEPGHQEYEWNYTVTLLQSGDYGKGWEKYDKWRWTTAGAAPKRFEEKPWRGQRSGGRLLLWGEQGIGDEILYTSMLGDFADAGLKVTLEIDHRLVAMMQRSFPFLSVVPRREPRAVKLASFDWQCPLGSLGAFLRPGAKSFPRHAGYLKPDPARVAALSPRVRASGARCVVGLSWTSTNRNFGARKNSALEDWTKILAVPGIRFVDLQYGDTSGPRSRLKEQGIDVLHLDDVDVFNDLEGLAALCSACDLVITTSNVTAHMAGALGKPVWMLLPIGPGRIWYWLAGRVDSPWYPTMRIFRQPKMGDWTSVTGEVAKALAKVPGGVQATPNPSPADLPRIEKLLREAIKKAPTATRHADLAEVLKAQGKNDAAITAYRDAVKLDSGDSRLHISLANLLVEAGDVTEAISHYRKVIELRPRLASAHNNLASALGTLGRYQEALESCERAISLEPGHQDYEWNYTVALLQSANYARGWERYDKWRWTTAGTPPKRYEAKPWGGERTRGGRLLVWAEQGIGDQMLYLNMLGELATAGLKVTVEIDGRLVSLVERSFPGVRAVPKQDRPDIDLANFDWQCPMGSLGRWLRPDFKSFPRHAGYFKPDPERVAALSARLRSGKPGRIVGIAWVSANPQMGIRNTIDLESWIDILRVPGVKFIDLQHGDTSAARARLKALGVDIVHLDDVDVFNDLEGLAALCSACDLIITSGNTTAPMAGALGKPVWTLLPMGVGRIWCWLAGRADSPWFPSMRIFSQKRSGNWNEPLAEVARELARMARKR